MANYVIRFARSATIVLLFAAAAVLGILSGVLFAYAGDLPEISALDNYNPSTITRVYAANGEVIGEFAVQRRQEGLSLKNAGIEGAKLRFRPIAMTRSGLPRSGEPCWESKLRPG